MAALPIETAHEPLSYRDVLITRTERPRATRPKMRAIWSLLVLVLAAIWAGAIVKGLFTKWFASPSASNFFAAEWYVFIGLLILVFFEFGGLRFARRNRAMEVSAAKKMNAVTTTLSSCHMVILEQPTKVAAVIDEAAKKALTK